MIAVESVIGEEHHRRIGARGFEEATKRGIVPFVHRVHHATKETLLALGDMRHLRRDKLHEVVADRVDRVKEDHRRVPRATRLQLRDRRALDARGIRHQFDERLHAPVANAYFIKLRQERLERVARKRPRALPARGDRVLTRCGMDGARDQRPRGALARWLALLQQIRHHTALDRLRGMRRVPADDVRRETVLRKDVPERLRLSRRGRRHAEAAAIRLRLDEIENAVLVRGLARSDRRPQEGREFRLQRAKIGTRTRLNQPAQHGHLARGEEAVDQNPIGGIPTDDEKALRDPCGHGAMLREAANDVRSRLSQASLPRGEDRAFHHDSRAHDHRKTRPAESPPSRDSHRSSAKKQRGRSKRTAHAMLFDSSQTKREK